MPQATSELASNAKRQQSNILTCELVKINKAHLPDSLFDSYFVDIYHRILRFKNYFIAMVNKEVIPLKVSLPVIGDL